MMKLKRMKNYNAELRYNDNQGVYRTQAVPDIHKSAIRRVAKYVSNYCEEYGYELLEIRFVSQEVFTLR